MSKDIKGEVHYFLEEILRSNERQHCSKKEANRLHKVMEEARPVLRVPGDINKHSPGPQLQSSLR